MAVNARIVLNSKEETASNVTLKFAAVYKEGENTWSYYTPSMQVTMVVRKEVASLFEIGETYSLDFNKVPSEPVMANVPPHPHSA